VLLGDVNRLIQTIYHESEVSAVAADELSGKIAVCAARRVFVYAPTGGEERFLKVLFFLPPLTSPPLVRVRVGANGAEAHIVGFTEPD
jgi:hypothetical protein